MGKKMLCFAAGIFLTATAAYGQETCTVSGDVVYSGDKDVFVCLHSAGTFPTWKKELPPGSFTKILKASQTGRTPFSFVGIPKGDYLIVAFIDENCNGKLDCDPWGGMGEQARMYKEIPMRTMGNWYDQKFAVQQDVKGIEFNF